MILLSYLLFAVQRLWLETALIAASAPVQAPLLESPSFAPDGGASSSQPVAATFACPISGARIDNRPGVRVPLQPLQQGWPCSAQNVAAGAGPVAGGVGLAGGAGSGSFLVPATPTSSHHRFNCFSTPTSRNSAPSATATLTQVKIYCLEYLYVEWFPHYLQYPALC